MRINKRTKRFKKKVKKYEIELVKNIIKNNEKVNKKWLCKIFKISRWSVYYNKKQRIKDLKLKINVKLENILNPYYGHRRIAISLKINKKTASRIMNKFEIYCKTRKKKFSKPLDRNLPHMWVKNSKKTIELNEINQVWSQDFTHLYYRWILFYLATVIDEYSKEVVWFSIWLHHEKWLILNALKMAVLKKNTVPKYAHSDQWSEYRSYEYFEALARYKISASMSKKSSPWENWAQESFYWKFKFELWKLNRFDSFEKAVEAVILQIHYYNNFRIHTKLKMSPVQFVNLIPKK